MKAQLMHETLDIFEGCKKQTKDYHGIFNTNYFVKWMQLLLDGLKARNITNAIIAMDNAKYHKTLPDETPKGNWKKSDYKQHVNAMLSCMVQVTPKP